MLAVTGRTAAEKCFLLRVMTARLLPQTCWCCFDAIPSPRRLWRLISEHSDLSTDTSRQTRAPLAGVPLGTDQHTNTDSTQSKTRARLAGVPLGTDQNTNTDLTRHEQSKTRTLQAGVSLGTDQNTNADFTRHEQSKASALVLAFLWEKIKIHTQTERKRTIYFHQGVSLSGTQGN